MKVKKESESLLEQIETFQQRSEEIKFDLYVQTRRVRQISSALDEVLHHDPDSAAEDWIGDNSDIIDQLLEDLLDDSLLVLDGVELDDESKSLSVELMTNIKQTVRFINALIKKDQADN